jgi:glucan phosphorylase
MAEVCDESIRPCWTSGDIAGNGSSACRSAVSEGLSGFAQAIDEKGYQQELPDIWLTNGNPWEIARNDITYKIGFYGTVDNFKWSPAEQVLLNHVQRRTWKGFAWLPGIFYVFAAQRSMGQTIDMRGCCN